MESVIAPNEGKSIRIAYAGSQYARLPIRTHVVMKGDDVPGIAKKYVLPHMAEGDMLFVSERIVAISQGRAFPISEIRPSFLAKLLVKFVHKSPYGIGLGSMWTMELALREAGVPRMLFAAFASAVTKPFGMRGVFYKVVGNNINAIDGPCAYTLPPYNGYAKLGPKDPGQAAQAISRAIGHPVVIIDANDLGVAILGKSDSDIPDEFCKAVFKDNPLGQSKEQTPLCIVRRID